MTLFREFWTVFKILLRDTYFSGRLLRLNGESKKKKEMTLDLSRTGVSGKSRKAAGKIGIGILLGIGLISMLYMVVMYAYMITSAAVAGGYAQETLYTFIAMAQIAVLFLGSLATLNILFFSKDNQLLASLPLSSKSIFLAKFAMAYLSELFISTILLVPLLVTYGITAATLGVAISAWFYILIPIGVFLIPMAPLLIICLVVLPLMYLLSFIRKRAVSNQILAAVASLGLAGLYLWFTFGMMGMTESGEESGELIVLTPQIIGLLTTMKNATVFNYPLVNSFLGNNAALNFLYYVLGIVVVLAMAILLSAFFYRKAIAILIEGTGNKKKKSGKEGKDTYRNNSLRRSFFLKEWKNLIGNPTLLMGAIAGIVIAPVMILIFGGSLFQIDISAESTGSIANELYLVGFILYMASLMMATTNTTSLVGISLEGKNLYILKSLPISVKEIILAKLAVSNISNVAMALITSIVFCAVSKYHNVLIALLMLIILLVNGFAFTCNGLLSDLKNPYLKYKNITELTKNNKRTVKPMLIAMGVGFSYLLLGIVFAAISDAAITPVVKYVIFFGIEFVIIGLFAVFSFKNLSEKADDLYNNLEA